MSRKTKKTIKVCKRCVMPDNFPGVSIDKYGTCNHCRAYESRKTGSKKLKAEYKKKFESLLKARRGKGEYDLLMCYSGGKDSTYTLSELKKRYRLNILAFTMDNGFHPEQTIANIRSVVEKLSIDHMFFKPRFDVLQKIFKASMKKCLYARKTLERASTICTSCVGLLKYLSLRSAIEKEIPFIAYGWSPGQSPVTSSILKIDPVMMKSMERSLKGPMRKVVGSDIDVYFLNAQHYAKPDKFPYYVHPLAFLGYDEKKVLGKIKEFGWKRPPGVEMNATNCYLNLLADQVHIAKYGFHPYLLEIANLVREGYMSRAEGLRHLPYRKDQKVIRMVKARLGVR
jgi:tRNA(Ile)-lysidine synthase TilS/MesJ